MNKWTLIEDAGRNGSEIYSTTVNGVQYFVLSQKQPRDGWFDKYSVRATSIEAAYTAAS
jgi:hypothetical protein